MAAERKHEIRGTIGKERADRIIHHLAEVHRELAQEDGLDAWDMAEFGRLVDIPKNEIHRRIRDDDNPNRGRQDDG